MGQKLRVDRITVISLDRTPERRQRFLDMNRHLPIDVFSGIDGRSLDRDACVSNGLIAADNFYRPGALGSAASHIALWRRCADEGRSLHIAEDDAVIRSDFLAAASAALAALPSWHYVLWGWNFDWPMKVRLAPGIGSAVVEANQSELRQEWREFQASTGAPALARLLICSGTCCYSLSPSGARQLLDLILPIGAQPASYALNAGVAVANTTVDLEMSRHFEQLEAYVSMPCLAVSLNVHEESTILSE